MPAILNHKNSTGLAGGVKEGQNMAHLGHIDAPNCTIFWPSPAPPADPVEFLWFKMAGAVSRIEYYTIQELVLSKIATFGCFGVKTGGSLPRERLVKMIFL